MQQARFGLGLLLHGAKRDCERRVQRLGGGSGDCLGRRLGQRPAQELDRPDARASLPPRAVP
jgi:hypothetical protein